MNSKLRHTRLVPVDRDGFHRLSTGHPWLFRGNLTADFTNSATRSGIFPLGEHWFLCSTHSDIALRRLGPPQRLWPTGKDENREPIFETEGFERLFGSWLKAHLKERLFLKRQLLSGESCFRWIFSESDLLPGLIVDVFNHELVCQIQTEPLEVFWPVIKKYLLSVFQEALQKEPLIHELRRSKLRAKEGLVVEESAPQSGNEKWIAWNGLKWWMNPGLGQKTGAYFDQKDNHLAAVRWAKTLSLKEAWDLCCFHGGFGLHLAQQGLNVLGVDDSAYALEIAAKNAAQNGISGYSTQKADVFDFLRDRFDKKIQTEMIVLDPPGVSGSKKNLPSALRGLKELNLRAMHCLKPGGLLVSCTCSHAISEELLLQVVREAAHDVRRVVKVIEKRGPSSDHAPLVGFPESEYLRAWYMMIE